MNALVPCPACSRHLRRSETACPFCGTAVMEAMALVPERAMPTTRLGRSALFAFAAASVGAAGCGGDVNTQTSKMVVKEDAAANGGSSSSGGQIGVAPYGAPFPIGGRTGAGGNVGAGGETIAPPYGISIFTGGTTGADAGKDGAAGGAGGNFGVPHYGGPPQSLYGAPPAPK
jgi:hypothetical protein